jgi:hypothetical protein
MSPIELDALSDRKLLESCHAMLLQLTAKKACTPRADKVTFVPPTLEEVKRYCAESGLVIDANFFWNYFHKTSWVDANGNKVKNWKLKANTWSAQKDAKKQTGSLSLNRDIDSLIIAAGM